MRYLYKKKSHLNDIEYNDFLQECIINVNVPRPFHLCLKNEKLNITSLISRIYFWLITLGKYRIYYLCHNGNIVHTSYVVPKCIKFPFLSKGEYEIGPCVTNDDYRRKGSYCFMLNYITSLEEFKDACFYMIVSETNEASIKGIEKSGFCRCGRIRKSKLLKIYKVEK